jgi:hypothetical protein
MKVMPVEERAWLWDPLLEKSRHIPPVKSSYNTEQNRVWHKSRKRKLLNPLMDNLNEILVSRHASEMLPIDLPHFVLGQYLQRLHLQQSRCHSRRGMSTNPLVKFPVCTTTYAI